MDYTKIEELAIPFSPHSFETKIIHHNDDTPRIRLTEKAYNDMYILVDEAGEEISWLGTVREIDSKTFLIDEIFLLKQKSNMTETEIDDNAIADLGMEILLLEDGIKLANSLNFWGHSHHTMGTGPSGQDDCQLKSFIEDNGCAYYIRGILNKKGKIEFTILYNSGIEYKDVPWMILREIDDSDRDKWKDEIKEKVGKISYVRNTHWVNGYKNHGSYYDRITKNKNNKYEHAKDCGCVQCKIEKANGVVDYDYIDEWQRNF